MPWQYFSEIGQVFQTLRQEGFRIIGLEVKPNAASLWEFIPNPKTRYVFILGNEVTGIDPDVINQCDELRLIPMTGTKESLNVGVTAGIVMGWLAYQSFDFRQSPDRSE